MKLPQTKLAGLIILLIILVVFNAFAFLMTDEFEATFWSGYAFITVAWLCLAASVITIAPGIKTGTRAAFLTIPQVLYSLLYFLIQFVAGGIIMNSNMRVKASIALQLILLVVYAVVIMVNVIYKDRSKKAQASTKAELAFKQDLLMRLEDLHEHCGNDAVRARLQALLTEVRYSDPVSSNETLEYELRILDLVKELKAFVYEGPITMSAIQLCEEVQRLLKQRNEACATGKEQ
jgi:hypothetical protein